MTDPCFRCNDENVHCPYCGNEFSQEREDDEANPDRGEPEFIVSEGIDANGNEVFIRVPDPTGHDQAAF